MKKSFKSIISLVLTLAMLASMFVGSGSVAFAKSDSGVPAEELKVIVNYTDETITKTYTVSEVEGLGTHTERYSYLDNLPSVVIAEARGVYITDILDDMDVSYSKTKVKSIVFSSTDGGSKTVKYSGLSGYFYPNLASTGYEFIDDEFISNDENAVLAAAEAVDAMLAVECDWRRVASGQTFENSKSEADGDKCTFRYMPVAEKDSLNSVASGSLKWINQMEVNLNYALHGSSGNGSGSNNNNDNQTVPEIKPVQIPPISTVKGSLSDIAGHWAEDDIYRMVALGAVNGNPDGTFAPNGSVTRAEFVTMLMKSLVKTNHGVLEGTNKFADVKGHWAEKYIAAAVDEGVVKGTSDSTFEPNAKITRQEMAVMIVNALKLENKTGTVTGVDTSQIASWADSAVDICNDYGIMSYDGNKKFYPLNKATRAEAATVLWRALETKGYVTE